jgi:hypothetical protein
MALRPLENRPGAFDDRGERGAHLWGAYATTARGSWPGQWDLYLLDYRREGARFAAGSGTERRQTLGARWFGQAGALDWNSELVAQGGELRRPPARSMSAPGRWPPIPAGAGRTCRCNHGWG